MTKNTKFERVVEFTPAFDERHKDPKKDYGIGSVRIKFVLKGKKGAVQFLISTNWYLPKTIEEYKIIGVRGRIINLLDDKKDFSGIMGCDIGYHSKKPMFEGHKPIDEKCPYTDGVCYYDGSAMQSKEVVEILIREGSNAVWKYLENYYEEIFMVKK